MSESPSRSESAAKAIDPLDMSTEGDADLLAYMSMQGEYPAHAREAWAEFYRRHVRYLLKVCRGVLEGLPRPPGPVEDVVTETFMRAYERAGTFCEPTGLDADGKRRNVRGWLATIAKNLIRDLLRGIPEQGPEQQWDDERWNEEAAPEAGEEAPTSEQLAVLEEVLEEVLENDLDEREREVLRITYQYYVFGRKAQRLPNKVAEELAQQLGTTSENLRKIRQRALEKVRAGLKRRLGELPGEA